MKRSRLISLRLSEEEYRTLAMGCAGSGARSMSDHLRMLLGTRKGKSEPLRSEPEWLQNLNRTLAALTEKVEVLAGGKDLRSSLAEEGAPFRSGHE